MARKGQFTPELSRAGLARRKELAAQGKITIGRPKGVLGAKRIAKIKSRETFIDEVSKNAGLIAEELLKNTTAGDTKAGLGLLDRIGIGPTQKVEHEHKFSLIGLDCVRKSLNAAPEMIDATKDMRIIDTQVDVSDDE